MSRYAEGGEVRPHDPDDSVPGAFTDEVDTTSVDALRTRLARAFEVAALRDPSAELAAFEAVVRHEHGERIAKAIEADRTMTVYRLELDARIARDLSPPR